MEKRVSTIIIEPRLVLREALELLMGNHSYRVVCGVGSIREITSSVIPDGPELVILGAQSATSASDGAAGVRSLWPESKIIFLFDDVSPADFKNLLASEIDGCIPLFVSPDTLISTLDLIVSRNVRVMVMGDTRPSSKWRLAGQGLSQPASKPDKPRSNGGERGGMPVTMIGVTSPSCPAGGAGLSARSLMAGMSICRLPLSSFPSAKLRSSMVSSEGLRTRSSHADAISPKQPSRFT